MQFILFIKEYVLVSQPSLRFSSNWGYFLWFFPRSQVLSNEIPSLIQIVLRVDLTDRTAERLRMPCNKTEAPASGASSNYLQLHLLDCL